MKRASFFSTTALALLASHLRQADAFVVRPNVLEAVALAESLRRTPTSLPVALVDSEQQPFYGLGDSQERERDPRRFAAASSAAIQRLQTVAKAAAASTATTIIPSTPASAERRALDPLELPRHRDAELARARASADLELVVGRAAMVASVVLLLGEAFTGQSLPDQIASLFC